MRRRLLLLVPAVLALLGLLGPVPAASAYAPGHPPAVAGGTSGGDPYFPAAGNSGYQVRHYALKLRYVPKTKALTGRAEISAQVKRRDLRSFSLDLRGLRVSSVRVDGRTAAYTRKGQELVVTPPRVLRAGHRFTVVVRYGGTTGQPVDITDSLFGWVSYADGAFVANEADGAPTWFPVNDSPYDKATYDFRITVPRGTKAVANGDLVGRRTKKGWTTFHWTSREPMASYLATASSGDYVLSRQRISSRLTIINAVDEDLSAADRKTTKASLALQPEMLRFFGHRFGPYPFRFAGAIVDDDEDAQYALETQTRPIYSGAPDDATVAHELAHQWYGDSVTPRRWRDIWLNEGFATYAEWMWNAHQGRDSVAEQFATAYSRPASDEFWQLKVGDPGAPNIFDAPIYDRGAMTLHALRLKVGDRDFFRILRAWAQRNRYGVVSTADLVRLSERISGQQLDRLFATWIYLEGKPADPRPAPTAASADARKRASTDSATKLGVQAHRSATSAPR